MNYSTFDVHETRIGSQALVRIVLSQLTTVEDGVYAITPTMTAAEIDLNISRLKTELDRAAQKAKAIAQ